MLAELKQLTKEPKRNYCYESRDIASPLATVIVSITVLLSSHQIAGRASGYAHTSLYWKGGDRFIPIPILIMDHKFQN